MTVTVDLHHHVIPGFYWEASNEDGNAAGGITPPHWSLDGAIAYLDEAGIDVAVPSISTPGVHFGDDVAARTLAREVNEYLAGIKHDRPDRFGASQRCRSQTSTGRSTKSHTHSTYWSSTAYRSSLTPAAATSGTAASIRSSTSCSAARQSYSSTPPRPRIRSHTPSACPTRCWTIPSIRRGRSRSSTTATPLPVPRT
jgi:hypothetical protein